jgi:hypothetical protein
VEAAVAGLVQMESVFVYVLRGAERASTEVHSRPFADLHLAQVLADRKQVLGLVGFQSLIVMQQ